MNVAGLNRWGGVKPITQPAIKAQSVEGLIRSGVLNQIAEVGEGLLVGKSLAILAELGAGSAKKPIAQMGTSVFVFETVREGPGGLAEIKAIP